MTLWQAILAHHLIQSFAPWEATYEQAHKIHKRLADSILGEKYDYVISPVDGISPSKAGMIPIGIGWLRRIGFSPRTSHKC